MLQVPQRLVDAGAFSLYSAFSLLIFCSAILGGYHSRDGIGIVDLVAGAVTDVLLLAGIVEAPGAPPPKDLHE
jgi:hypothetical protein